MILTPLTRSDFPFTETAEVFEFSQLITRCQVTDLIWIRLFLDMKNAAKTEL